MKMKLQSVELKESKKGFPYVVCTFVKDMVNVRMAEQTAPVTLNFTAPYNACTDEERKDESVRNAKYKAHLQRVWIDDPTAKTDDYQIGGWDVDVEPYIRLTAEGKVVRNAENKPDVRNKLRIYGFCEYDDAGNELPLVGMDRIKQSAESRLANSNRLMTVAKWNEEKAKRDAAKKAAEEAAASRVSSPLVDDLDD